MGSEGKLVTFYWTQDRALMLRIGDTEFQMNPWIGVQMEEWQANGRDWRRAEIEKHEPVDLLGYLERIGEHKAVKRNTARLK